MALGQEAGGELHLAAGSGEGPSRLEAFSLAPGQLRHVGLSGRRQACGGGLWLERGRQRLSLGLLLREVAGEEDMPLEQTPWLQMSYGCDIR